MGRLHLISLSTVAFTLFSIVLFSCERESEGSNETNISRHDDDESHYNGHDCMNCHYRVGEGEGWFTLAGTAVDNFRNSTVILSTGPKATGTIVKNIEVDLLGNFYTTEPIDYGDGLYVAVESQNGEMEEMDGKIYSGSCNTCHDGNHEDPIEVE